jgi:hypothetical protein
LGMQSVFLENEPATVMILLLFIVFVISLL